MSAKLAFIALFLLVTGSLAQFARNPVDFVYDAAPFMEYARRNDLHRSTYDTETDALQFVEGFLTGVGSADIFEQVRQCVGDAENIITDITQGIEDIETKNAAQVKAGIQLLGQAAQIVPNAVQACKGGEAELKNLLKLVKTFQNPLSFLYYIGKSLIINHVDVLNEVSQAITAYQGKNYNQLGYWVGKAMDTIVIGNPEVEDVKTDVENFVEGFLSGIESAQLFVEIESCIGDAETFTGDVAAAISDIRSRDPARVKTGIYLLGEAAQIIPAAAQTCKAADADITNLVKLVATFQSPASFLYYIGKSLLINHVEVINEVNQAVDSFDASNFTQLGFWVGKAMDTVILGGSTAQDTKTDILDFVEGLLGGIGSAQAFDQVRACVTDSEDVITDISAAVADIASRDPARVKTGIQLIGQVAQIVPNAVQECKAGYVDLKGLIKMVEAFKNPLSFLYYVGKSLLINHVEVINEVEQAVSGYQANNFTDLGYWVGKAMDTVILGDDQLLTQDFADYLNKHNSEWKAAVPSKFEGMTLREIKGKFFGSANVDNSRFNNITVYNYEGAVNDIPASFNASEQWPGCVHAIRDQGQCGSCWAFAATEVLSDRLCIASNGSVNVVLSPQYLISCNDVLNHGCNGGVPLFSWWFIDSDGLVTDSCLPYESSNGTNPVKCKDFTTCYDGTPLKKYYGKAPAQLPNPASIQTNLMQYGPVEAGMTVYQDFMYYQGGVYKHTSGAELGGHAVKIIGWGNENGENYWIVANSWGATWGENGYFRIAWGQCGIDSACIAGQADLTKTQMSENRFW